MEHSIDNELLVINTLVYVDQAFKVKSSNLSVFDTLENIGKDAVVDKDSVINSEEWQCLKQYIEDNADVYQNLYINNIETQNGSKKLTLTDNDNNMYIVFQGTSSGYEWNDNGMGAYSNVVQTPSQKKAVDYYDRMVEQYGEGKNIYVSGHSKGGNEAQYVGILRGEQITRVYSFDGQDKGNVISAGLQPCL